MQNMKDSVSQQITILLNVSGFKGSKRINRINLNSLFFWELFHIIFISPTKGHYIETDTCYKKIKLFKEGYRR